VVWAVHLGLSVSFHFAVVGVPGPVLPYPSLVRLRPRRAVIDC
jgi:hypothetical protein